MKLIAGAAKALELKKVSVITWENEEDLEGIPADAKKFRVIFAELPVDYNLRKFEQKSLLGVKRTAKMDEKP
jgi:hypothetical protein